MSGIFDQIINYSPPLIVSGTVNYKGTWNASTNNPTLNSSPAASTKGDYYVVSTAGTQFGITFAIGDWIISNGTAWEKVDLTDAVSSVFGRTGAVVGVSTDYSAVGLTNTAIGASSPSTGAFTTVTASSTIAATGAVTGSNLSGTNTGDQTTITGNAGSATVLQTPRAIYGNNFDGSAALTQVIASTYGGTGNGFAKFSGPASSEKTFTLPNASSTLLYDGGALGTPSSGTVTNLTGTASININGTVGATTPSTGAFTTLATSGNMGIGTGAPSASSGYTTLQIDNATNGGVINLAKAGTVAAQIYSVGIDATISTIQSGSTLTINPHTANIFQIAGSEKGRFTSTGLGIGTTNPTGSLEIAKIASGALGANLFLRNNAATAAGNAVQISMSANSGGDATSPTAKIVMTEAANAYSKLGFFTYAADGVVERLTISSGGNVGIGVTPQTWVSTGNQKAIQISECGSISSLSASTGNQQVNFGRNVYDFYSAKYITSDNASAFRMQGDNSFAWFTAPSGTAGAAITFTQAMTLDATGNLVVGNTTCPYISSGRTVIGINGTSSSILALQSAGVNRGYLYADNSTFSIEVETTALKLNAVSASPITFYTSNTERARIDSSGNLLVGTTSQNGIITAVGSSQISHKYTGSSSVLFIGQYNSSGDASINNTANGPLVFATNNTERARITSAGLFTVGTGSAGVGRINSNFDGSTLDGIDLIDTVDASAAAFLVCRNSAGTTIGSIQRVTTTNAVVYNTTSDGRLKENLRDFTDSGRLIDSLKPRVFDWKNSDENGKNVIGFVAQEEHAADPIFAHIGAVSVGDEDPETITKQWQRSDSALIPILVAELKNVRQRLAALETK